MIRQTDSTLVGQADSILIAASKRGEGRAFDALVERYNSKIFAVAFRITRHREDAEDIVQLSFQKAFIHLQSFEGRSSFSTWLTRIAINEALMWMRKTRALREVALESTRREDESAACLEIPDVKASPEETCALEERSRILASAMNRLPSPLRTTLRLHLEGRTAGDVAQIMGIQTPTIKAMLFRARQKLRKHLTSLSRIGEETQQNRGKAA
jgi:RNA polymerase sigma-70 factor (ECF subfamily)